MSNASTMGNFWAGELCLKPDSTAMMYGAGGRFFVGPGAGSLIAVGGSAYSSWANGESMSFSKSVNAFVNGMAAEVLVGTVGM